VLSQTPVHKNPYEKKKTADMAAAASAGVRSQPHEELCFARENATQKEHRQKSPKKS